VNAPFFTSDTHFGHAYAAAVRGFTSVDAMDAMLIECWNDKVRPTDTVYHLGDFSFANRARAGEVFGLLHGRKHLVVGNHDSKAVQQLPWETVGDLRTVRWEGRKLILCHFPMLSWAGAHKGAWHLHGHSHGNLRAAPTTRFDVGVDTSPDLGPWALDELVDLYGDREFVPVDHHEVPASERAFVPVSELCATD
jgi:calcineurin-like phosphoesterase family protein